MVYNDETNRVYATASDKSIHIFNGETGDLITSVSGEHTKTVYDVKLYPAGQETLLATCSGDNTIKTWKADETGDSLVCDKTISLGLDESPDRSYQALICSKYQESLYTIALNLEGTVVHIKDGEVLGTSISSKEVINGLAFAGDHIYFTSDKFVFRSNLEGETTLIRGLTNTSTVVQLVSDGQSVYVSTNDNKLQKIVGDALDREAAFDRPATAIVPCEGTIFTLRLSDDGQTQFVDQLDGDLAVQQSNNIGMKNASCMGFSQGTGHLWIGDLKGNVHIFNPANGFEKVESKEVSRKKICQIIPLTGEGAQIATFDGIGEICVWDAGSREKAFSLRAQRDEVLAAGITADGQHIYSASNDNTLYHFDRTGDKVKEKHIKTPHEGKVTNFLAINPSDQTIYTAGLDHIIRIWETTHASWK